MARPKGSRSVRSRRLQVAKDLEALITKVDERITAGAIDVKLIQERAKLSALVLRALREADSQPRRRRF
jgi:hypothetical protein